MHLAAIRRTIAFMGSVLVLWHVWQTVCRVNGWKPPGPHPAVTFFVFLLLAALCSGTAWVVYRRYQRAMNSLYNADERETLRNAFREMNEQQSQQLRESHWKVALVAITISVTAFFLMFFVDASAMAVCFAVVAMYLICRPFFRGGVAVDLDEDAKRMLLRPKSTPNKWRVDRNEDHIG
ncbi:MAG: hypothetical protein ACYC4B_26420 [Pirellulaceae bacterium]